MLQKTYRASSELSWWNLLSQLGDLGVKWGLKVCRSLSKSRRKVRRARPPPVPPGSYFSYYLSDAEILPTTGSHFTTISVWQIYLSWNILIRLYFVDMLLFCRVSLKALTYFVSWYFWTVYFLNKARRKKKSRAPLVLSSSGRCKCYLKLSKTYLMSHFELSSSVGSNLLWS